jgi:hypothetical protein
MRTKGALRMQPDTQKPNKFKTREESKENSSITLLSRNLFNQSIDHISSSASEVYLR